MYCSNCGSLNAKEVVNRDGSGAWSCFNCGSSGRWTAARPRSIWLPILAFVAILILAFLFLVGQAARGDEPSPRAKAALVATFGSKAPADPFGHGNHATAGTRYRVAWATDSDGTAFYYVTTTGWPKPDDKHFTTVIAAEAEADRLNAAGKVAKADSRCGCGNPGVCSARGCGGTQACDDESCPRAAKSGPMVGDTDGEGFTYRWSDQYRAYGWYKQVDPPPSPVTYYAPPVSFVPSGGGTMGFFGGGGGGNCGPRGG